MILFFGSLCYMQGIYDFFEKSKTKHIGISRLPMITNSTEDFIAFDNFGDHYEYFMSYEKFKKMSKPSTKGIMLYLFNWKKLFCFLLSIFN